ncbi:universal stress protein [Halobacillus andaensis]|uniref:universal stress protein n=1 Tax=Halobacillus andaensis TaxID=1176239 RepID=UPI003D73BDCA
MLERILLASDGSDHAVRATHTAIKLTGDIKTGLITVLYAIDGATSKADVLSEGDPKARERRRRKRIKRTEDVLIKAQVPYQTKIIKGDPGPTIVQYANEHNFDVVVVGSRGLNSLQEMVLGSVSHKVAKRAECPVMIVK